MARRTQREAEPMGGGFDVRTLGSTPGTIPGRLGTARPEKTDLESSVERNRTMIYPWETKDIGHPRVID